MPGSKERTARGRAGGTRLLKEFGRRHPGVVLADLGCPDCRGVLEVREAGKRGWLEFRCRVGHGFAADSLLEAKSQQIEESLWSVAAAMSEVAQLYEVLASRQRSARRVRVATELDRYARATRKQLRIVEELAEHAPVLQTSRGQDV